MDNDGEDVRAYACSLCLTNAAIHGERLCESCSPRCERCNENLPEPGEELCAKCRVAREEDGPADASQPDRAGDSDYSPTYERDCGRWI